MADAKYYAKKFGVPKEVGQEWIDKRPDACPICQLPKTPKQLVLDHDKKTGWPRGWLCRLCNGRIVGAVEKRKDRIGILRRVIEYLEKPPLQP